MKTKNILIVENDEKTRKFIGIVFAGQAVNVVTAVNGREALDVLMADDIDLVISDITMPKMTGIELLKEIKHLGIRTLFIFMSSHEQESVDPVALSVDAYFRKPIIVSEVMRAALGMLGVEYRERSCKTSTA
jgi:CheY-like chemotaxis protein